MEFTRSPHFRDLAGDITPEPLFANRRAILAAAGVTVLGAMGEAVAAPGRPAQPEAGAALKFAKTAFKVKDPLASEQAATTYNNFYEFGTGKSDPARNSGKMTTAPWDVEIEGLAGRTGAFKLVDLVDFGALEERIYRLRCVEAWSMVLPWVGVPLSKVIAKAQPKKEAKYVQFVTYANPREMPGLRYPALDWPYVEGLRMDEAMNDLAFVAVGLYGKSLLPQNGAPVRIVVPWKYGFKSAKSVVKIRLTASEPTTSWNQANPGEYGFYSNVNPTVDHPRWSQASERVLGGTGFAAALARRDTEMFNGYGDAVAGLYKGMDLKKFY